METCLNTGEFISFNWIVHLLNNDLKHHQHELVLVNFPFPKPITNIFGSYMHSKSSIPNKIFTYITNV